MSSRQARLVSLMTNLILTLSVQVAFAQSQARVVHDSTMIWRADESVVAATVPAGTVLDVVGRAGTFYTVVIPENFGGHGQLGRIAEGSVVLVPGSGDRPVRATTVEPSPAGDDGRRPVSPSPTPGGQGHAIAVRAFGQAGLAMPSARESFRTVTNQAYLFAFGGGVQLLFRNGAFVESSLDQLKKTGESVFIDGEDVFPLGVANTITIRPLLFTAGYRFASARSFVPYLGGGIGVFHLNERTPFSEEGEAINENRTGYRMSVGVEFGGSQSVSAAIETAYTRVPDSLGFGGVSQVVGERDLGGLEFRVKVLFGR
jgi:opacity protein-like surface antigen